MSGGSGYRHPVGDSLVLLSPKPHGGSRSQSSVLAVWLFLYLPQGRLVADFLPNVGFLLEPEGMHPAFPGAGTVEGVAQARCFCQSPARRPAPLEADASVMFPIRGAGLHRLVIKVGLPSLEFGALSKPGNIFLSLSSPTSLLIPRVLGTMEHPLFMYMSLIFLCQAFICTMSSA